MRRQTVLISASSFFFLSACSAMTSEVARDAAPQMVDAGLEAASAPENKKQIQDVVSDTPIKASVVGIEGFVVDTVLARLASEHNEKQLRRLARTITSAMAQEVANPAPALKQRKDTILNETITSAVQAAIAELRRSLPALIRDIAESPEVQKAVKPLSESAAGGAVKGAADTIIGEDQPEDEGR